jgi:hypothetical protein
MCDQDGVGGDQVVEFCIHEADIFVGPCCEIC